MTEIEAQDLRVQAITITQRFVDQQRDNLSLRQFLDRADQVHDFLAHHRLPAPPGSV
jgi:hypothetical protein